MDIVRKNIWGEAERMRGLVDGYEKNPILEDVHNLWDEQHRARYKIESHEPNCFRSYRKVDDQSNRS